jgi:hypothetical protein
MHRKVSIAVVAVNNGKLNFLPLGRFTLPALGSLNRLWGNLPGHGVSVHSRDLVQLYRK